MDKKIRYGIIGVGAQGGAYAGFLTGQAGFPGFPAAPCPPHCALGALCDVDPAKEAMCKEKYADIPFYSDWKEMIASGNVAQIRTCDQQQICFAYEHLLSTASVCASNPEIDENNVKSVLRNYRHHWREMLISLRISLSPLIILISSCFANYSAQFMQIHRGCNRLFLYTT